ncbi:4Fe-4S binding protein [bacterium]|nr:4Fe-4S binding protein [bacterium]
MQKDVYIRLREFLDALPVGYPATPTGVELKILEKLFTPPEAELTLQLRESPESVSEIARRTGAEAEALADQLETMARKGLIFRVRDDDGAKYQAFQFMIGIYEFQVNAIDREFSEMMEAYLPFFGKSMVKTPQLRVVPVESAVGFSGAVAPYNQIRNLVRQQTTIAVTPCICRKEQGFMGNECSKPRETCLSFGPFAEYYIENQFGRQIDIEAALGVLDMAEENGLVLSPTNSREIQAICCCCTCCCPALKNIKFLKHPASYVRSYYAAKIDMDLCTACEECLDRCPMDAIRIEADVSEIIDGRCIGCGLCVSTCATEAIHMQLKPGLAMPPDTLQDTFEQIRQERNRKKA